MAILGRFEQINNGCEDLPFFFYVIEGNQEIIKLSDLFFITPTLIKKDKQWNIVFFKWSDAMC